MRPRSLMDKVTVFETVDVGSIPTGDTKIKTLRYNIRGNFYNCFASSLAKSSTSFIDRSTDIFMSPLLN